MKHISILAPRGDAVVDTIIAPYNLLSMANVYCKRLYRKEVPYKIDLVGLTSEIVNYQGVFSVQPTTTLEKLIKTDLIIVSAIAGNLEREIEKNLAFVDWMRAQRLQYNCDIASLCKGAFLLAETGLIDGKNCSTHWTAHNLFRKRYPKVNLIPEKIISEDDGIYSSGGAYSFLNFMLYLIEKLYGREVAIRCSKVSEIEYDRLNQSPFIIFSGQKEHNDQAILQAQNHIEKNYESVLNINDIAKMVHVSSRSFLRRFKKATANTPLEYVQRVKMEAAKKTLEMTSKNINEVMYEVGYIDEKAFRNTFKKYVGLAPKAYQLKYNRDFL